jgi:hypothetical protein
VQKENEMSKIRDILKQAIMNVLEDISDFIAHNKVSVWYFGLMIDRGYDKNSHPFLTWYSFVLDYFMWD